MTLPAALLGLLISSVLGVLYHLVRGDRLARLLLYLGLAWFGFALGHLIGFWRGWMLFPLGPLNLGAGSLGSLVLMGAGDWLSRLQAGRRSSV
jgi:hypothetical protein